MAKTKRKYNNNYAAQFLMLASLLAIMLTSPSFSTTTTTTTIGVAMAFTSSFRMPKYKVTLKHQPLFHRPRMSISSLLILASSTEEEEEEEESPEQREKRLKKETQDQIFWAKQKALAASMTAETDAAIKKEQLDKFSKRRLALISDTIFFSILLFSLLWTLFPSPRVPISYEFGALLGTAYSYGLGKYVETIGGSTEDEGAVEGAGVGQARFAFLILLFVVLGKFRGEGGYLLELPAIGGFFTYQLASLNQGLKEYYD